MIYIEPLIIEDFLLNYIIILGTSTILNRITNFKRIFASSLIGLIPLIILFVDISQSIINIISLIFSLIMSIVAFKYKNLVYTIQNTIYMYFISIFLAGSIYLLNTNFFPKVDNYILSIGILLIFSPIITYIYVKLLKKLKNNYSNYYKVDIYLKDKPKVTVTSFLDTGNQLIDPYFHNPIILISNKIVNIDKEKIILVPYRTIDDKNLLKCFKPEKIYIDKVGTTKNVLIGIIDEVNIDGVECILTPKILERINNAKKNIKNNIN